MDATVLHRQGSPAFASFIEIALKMKGAYRKDAEHISRVNNIMISCHLAQYSKISTNIGI
ncbi:hypothetical protein ACLBWS_15295 [Brucellaceae bacterium D45D]